MNKKISIIIPQYSEDENFISPLLLSIYNQIGFDFDNLEVIIVNDNSKILLSNEFIEKYSKINIKYIIKEKNEGSGLARQTGIENAQNDYLLFCDADDILYSCNVLKNFNDVINSNEDTSPDIVYSNWYEELCDENNNYIYKKHEDEMTWMFAKAYKKLFLINNNIKFENSLRVHEDSYFNAIAFRLAKNIKKINDITYVWRFNKNSITRNENHLYSFNSMCIFIDAIELSINNLIERNIDITQSVYQLCCYIYFVLQSNQWKDKSVLEYRTNLEKKIYEFFEKYRKYFDSCDIKIKYEIYNKERNKAYNQNIYFMEIESFEMFLVRLINTYGNKTIKEIAQKQ